MLISNLSIGLLRSETVLHEAGAISDLVIQSHRGDICFVRQPNETIGAEAGGGDGDRPDERASDSLTPMRGSSKQVLEVAVVAGRPKRTMKNGVRDPYKDAFFTRPEAKHRSCPRAWCRSVAA